MRIFSRANIGRIAQLMVALALCAGCATTMPALRTVESSAITANPELADFSVTLHVLLQVHEHPDAQQRARQDAHRVAACQENIVAIALRLAEGGVRGIVAEGLYAEGTPEKPEPVRLAQIPSTNVPSAKWLLAGYTDLSVYGFELKPLNEFGVGVVSQLGSSAALARERAKDGYDAMSPEAQKEYARHIQDEITRLNLWYAGVVPERSFLALQTALAVASARRENQVQLLIGKQHWSDLVYAVNRHQDVRLRLVPHPCE